MFIGVCVCTFVIMEFVAWATHKYVMHGFLWSWHKSHHKKTRGFFERNDLFFVFFGFVGAFSIITGLLYNDIRLPIGIGVTIYGITYITVHDIFIHKRLRIFGKTDTLYFRALQRAHHAHHGNIGKHDGESFGLLFVGRKYWQQELEKRRSKK